MELQELPRLKFKMKRPRESKYPKSEPVIVAELRKIRFGFNVKTMTCPYCRTNITTKIEVRTTVWTHLAAVALCLICLCPFVPCVYGSKNCLTLKHYCCNCDRYLGETGFLPFLRRRRRHDK